MPLSWNEIRSRAIAFSKDWADVGSERAEAQSFWNAFFGVFGMERRRVASFEQQVAITRAGQRIKNGRIDAFWKGTLLVEHKSAGQSLDRAFAQAVDYFDGIAERDLPRYVIVSDFARMRLSDFETGEDVEFAARDLHKHIKRFGFIAGYRAQEIRPQDPVNIRAAERMGALHDALKGSGYEGHALEVLLVRLLFCLFADDTGIFQPAQAFRSYIEDRTASDGADLGPQLGQLFQVLNTPEGRRSRALDEQLGAFPYVNGALFAETLPLAAFDAAMRERLLDACAIDWSGISPAIFGALFQSIMDAKARRNLGAHYTSEENILKLIKPLFLDELRAEFERIKGNRNRLFEFHKKLRALRFLDPACGCGNFLVITYRELRLLELDVLRAVSQDGQLLVDIHQRLAVDVDQFHGIEIEEFPAQIAQVALWLMDHQMNVKAGEEFGLYFARIPLKATPHIVHGNALRLDWGAVLPQSHCSYVLGNPPFVGHHLQSAQQKADLRHCAGATVAAGVLDLVAAWYFKAADYVVGSSIRFAFVSTNSITQGEQVGIMWRGLHQRAPLHIHFAHRTFRWSNEASGRARVYCVIVGLGCSEPSARVLFDYATVDGAPHPIQATNINAYLVDAPWLLLPNSNKNRFGQPEMRYGSKPTDGGHFFVTDDERDELAVRDRVATRFVRRFVGAHEYLNDEPRWVLWLVGAQPSEINGSQFLRSRVEAVAAFRSASSAPSTRTYKHPTLFRQVTQPQTPYVLVPGHTSENRAFIPFGFFGPEVIVGNSCFSIPGATLFHFGVIQATMHMAWIRSTCGRLEGRYRYSKDVVYNNFPWPSAASEAQRRAIEVGAQSVLDARAAFAASTLSDLYDPLTMPPVLVKAHQVLDKAVDAAYGRKGFKSDAERVAFLFELYQKQAPLPPSDKPSPKQRAHPHAA